jgi:hypothetical protein
VPIAESTVMIALVAESFLKNELSYHFVIPIVYLKAYSIDNSRIKNHFIDFVLLRLYKHFINTLQRY